MPKTNHTTNKYALITLILSIFSCVEKPVREEAVTKPSQQQPVISQSAIVVLGTIQDAGSPQIGCNKACCVNLFENPDHTRRVTSLGVIDMQDYKTYLFEASPDIASQMKSLTRMVPKINTEVVDGIFLTHAHIGHYTGLMYLGKEAIDAQQIPVYAMPRLKDFLSTNGPWGQLVTRKNIVLTTIANNSLISLSSAMKVTPLLVPHRDEYSETVGYRIQGPAKSALFIPDIDKWEKWDKDIVEEVKKVDYAFLDATFYNEQELNNRDMSDIPHPFIVESMERFETLSLTEKNKIVFIHFNHTNPIINPSSKESQWIIDQGFRIARMGDVYPI